MTRKEANDRIYSSRRWRRLRLSVLDRAGWRCRKCGRAGRLEVHHREPVREGGEAWCESNLQPLCRTCHFRTHVPLPPDVAEWRAFAGA